MPILTSGINNCRSRRRLDGIRAMLAAQTALANGCEASPLEQVFLFGGAGGLDEKALVRFRAHKSHTLRCNFVPVRSWANGTIRMSTLASWRLEHVSILKAAMLTDRSE
jgi:hypothetical protein